MLAMNLPGLRDMHRSPFLDLVAVEAWDAWFRWRDEGLVRDLSIGDTWRRVAHALASCEPPAGRAAWERHLFDACADWRLLPDERVLASAGTSHQDWPHDQLGAALNAAVFVRSPFAAGATFRFEAFEATAGLAVHALDNAALLAGQGRPGTCLRVGVIGLADALLQLGHAYDSEQGRRTAQDIAISLARGCLRESLGLARERGAWLPPGDAPSQQRRLRQFSAALPADAGRDGLRHAALTAIEPRRRLALLANNVADAVDPLLAHGNAQTILDGDTARTVCSPGYALTLAGRLHARHAVHRFVAELTRMSPSAQGALRNAMQDWIDQPIHYPWSAPVAEATIQTIAAHASGG